MTTGTYHTGGRSWTPTVRPGMICLIWKRLRKPTVSLGMRQAAQLNNLPCQGFSVFCVYKGEREIFDFYLINIYNVD